MSIGVSNMQFQPKAPIGGGGPVTANNGVSIDGSGNVVLGNDVGDTLAELLSDRMIFDNGFFFEFAEGVAQNQLLSLRSDNVQITNLPSSSQVRMIADGSQTFLNIEADASIAGFPTLIMNDTSNVFDAQIYQYVNDGTMQWENAAGFRSLLLDFPGSMVKIGDIDDEFPVTGVRMTLDSSQNTASINGDNLTGLKGDMLRLNQALSVYELGDLDIVGGGTTMQIDDGSGRINFFNGGMDAVLSINNQLGFSGTVLAPTSIEVVGGLVINVT